MFNEVAILFVVIIIASLILVPAMSIQEQKKRQERERLAKESKERERRAREEAKERERIAKERERGIERQKREKEKQEKAERDRALKEQMELELENKKYSYSVKIDSFIQSINETKKHLIIKSNDKVIDELLQTLCNNTKSIHKIKTVGGFEWLRIDDCFNEANDKIQKLLAEDKKISDYYDSSEFAKIKQTCDALTQSQKEFNEYISEKASLIATLFGKKVVRDETQHNDIFNYNRKYVKSLDAFSTDVSSSVLSAAENNPIPYVVKHFYPDKTKYKVQIEKLQTLLDELETLKEAKAIIDNYKKDYEQYIQNVPDYVLDDDIDGFYSRLGMTIIDEAVLKIEYRFSYTSEGGMARRSFSVPMNEETIPELINVLESKLSTEALAKEQRALMTAKLRLQIKERDLFTCCQCGNSVYDEPNLLLEIDHIIPISKGGLTVVDNLQTLCWKCNRSKGAKII